MTAAGRDAYVAERDQHFRFESGAGAAVRRAVSPTSGETECPYPGLAAFGEEERRWFYGRDTLIQRALNLLDARAAAGVPMVVAGPSGAGKPSVVFCGSSIMQSDGEPEAYGEVARSQIPEAAEGPIGLRGSAPPGSG